MTEFARINQPRVDKILAALDTIEKSARSNRTEAAEVAELLAPLAERIAALTAAPDQAEGTATVEAASPAVADEAFAAALDAVRAVHYHRVGLLADAVPEIAVAPLVTQLVNRLAERPAPQNNGAAA